MKNLIKTLSVTMVVTVLLSYNSVAQQMFAGNTAKTVYATGSIDIKEANTVNINVATTPDVETKFAVLFPSAANLQWSGTDKNYWVSFLNNGRKTTASFTPKGKMNYVISDCTTDQLPAAFRNTIKKEYALYNLYNAIEIKAYNSVAYQAVLENSVNFITLKYTSDGVEEIKQVKKTIN